MRVCVNYAEQSGRGCSCVATQTPPFHDSSAAPKPPYPEHKRLLTLADGATLVGAEAFQLDDVTVTDGSPHVVLESSTVATSVEEYVASNPLSSLDEIHIDDASSADGTSANVTLSAYWRPPVLSLLVPEGLRIEVTAVARSMFF